MTVTAAACVWVEARLIAGVTATICVGVTDCTNASFVPAGPASKSTRTGCLKFVPVMVTTVPPAGGPVFGRTLVIVGAVEGGPGGVGAGAPKVTVMLFVTLLTVAVMVATPVSGEVRAAVVTPLVVVRMVR